MLLANPMLQKLHGSTTCDNSHFHLAFGDVDVHPLPS